MQIKIKKLHPNATIPRYQTQGSAGFDLHSIEDICLGAGERILVKTGLAFEIPDGFEMQIRPRSGLALKLGISVLNSPGTIDSDYRGEVGIILINHSKDDFKISCGERIAQGVITQIFQADFLLSDDLSSTERGEGGFGSSGI
ncbi:dUTP diphosphatase [Helicobacter kayseriensis]|uniref:dUTP diphosphatase n=1 Tax=Helicobacter kayseriensis TaxID=2905877 RepID=UPI001E511ED4|nr:dUTP diphosphatase [Helicobacter kayseriensis]MCE3046765.1 dUTP diphosphatase [Helicobacter kayseriensis]MCE3047933.1 dUTP diphosphatase [Helicobacter kayseriensis]